MGLGAGNDGGVIASQRAFLVKVAVTEKKRDYGHVNAIRFSTCALTSEPLRAPVACDELGSLYNKDAVVQYLLEKRDVPAFSHLRSLKRDVISIRATPNPAYIEGSSAAVEGGKGTAPFVCPISGVEANGQHAFVAFRRCGCMVSDRAVREMGPGGGGGGGGGAGSKPPKASGGGALTCPACGTACSPDDIIKLCPTEEEADFLRARIAQRRAALRAAAPPGPAAAPLADAASGAGGAAGSGAPASEDGGAPAAGLPSASVPAAAAAAPGAAAPGEAPAAALHAGSKRPRAAAAEAAGGGGGASAEAAPAAAAVAAAARGAVARPAAPASAPPAHSSGSSVAYAAALAADEAIGAQRAASSVYAKLLRPQGADRDGQSAGKAAENLFIRTTTSVYTKNRGAF